jgi:ABC-2 type transport system permease protein
MVIMIFVPFYVVSLIVSDPHALIVEVMTYFPYTAPVTAMLRNGFGSLPLLESCIVLVELFGLGFLALRVAVQLFRYGSISYTSKLSVRTALRRSRAV